MKQYYAMLGAVAADWVTTQVGLSRGFIETHAGYSPIWALLTFTVCLAVVDRYLTGKLRRVSTTALIGVSLLGAVNNCLVLTGVFGGWII